MNDSILGVLLLLRFGESFESPLKLLAVRETCLEEKLHELPEILVKLQESRALSNGNSRDLLPRRCQPNDVKK